MVYAEAGMGETDVAQRGYKWLASVRRSDGGWSGAVAEGDESRETSASSVEETALVVEALLAAPPSPELQLAASQGLQWLVDAVLADRHRKNAPIGFYFARLWYYEDLYPLVFAVAALGRAVRRFGS